MILKKITIENYRSIEHLEIDILDIDGRKLHTFFGINETGKSNILKAIALLNPTTTVNYDLDCNKNANKHAEPIIVTFLFETAKHKNLYKKMKSFGIDIEMPSGFKPRKVEKSIQIEKVIKFNDNSTKKKYHIVHPSDRSQKLQISENKFNYPIDDVTEFDDKLSSEEYYIVHTSDKLKKPQISKNKFKYPIDNVTEFNNKSTREEYYIVHSPDGGKKLHISENQYKYPIDDVKEFVMATVDSLSKNNIEKCTNVEAKDYFDSIVPEVIFWEPSDSYLITNQINLEQFKQNPDVSIPLKHIFYLAGYKKEEITKNIERIQTNGDTRADFEDELSGCITEHINRIWHEHPININIRLENNNFCEIYVEDKGVKRQRFNMQQRSDGFKQFISILLSLSVQNATNNLKDKIILLDEPERSLHPGSIKCLRDELLRISKNNVILVSSHSTYMVDKKKLERHYTVTKNNSKTVIEQVNPDSPIQDEVIYNSLGTSIFELIEPNMLILEGRSDKDIFDAFTNKFEEDIQPSRIQTISATGTKQIPKYVKFFYSKFINGFVVVDSDNDGRNAIKAIHQQDADLEDSVFELKQLVDLHKKDATLEDLLPEELVLSCAKTLYKTHFESSNENSILSHIKSIKKSNSMHTDGKLEELKKLITHRVLDDVKNEDKDTLKTKYPLYFTFMAKLHSKIKDDN